MACTVSLRLDPSQTGRLSCLFCSGKFQSPHTEFLSSPPVRSSLPSESFRFLPYIILILLFHIASSSKLFSYYRGQETALQLKTYYYPP